MIYIFRAKVKVSLNNDLQSEHDMTQTSSEQFELTSFGENFPISLLEGDILTYQFTFGYQNSNQGWRSGDNWFLLSNIERQIFFNRSKLLLLVVKILIF
jgi:hypothetical protein